MQFCSESGFKFAGTQYGRECFCESHPPSEEFLLKVIILALNISFLSKYFFGVPHLATCIFLFFYNEPELGVRINPGMALTPLPFSIGQGSIPQPYNCELSALPLDHSFRCNIFECLD